MKKDKTETIETVDNTIKKPEKKGFKIFKSVVNVVINVLIVLVLIASLLIAALSLTSRSTPGGVPNIFGYTLQYVQTNSMAVEPPEGFEGGNFSDKDVIICKASSADNFPELEVGDIITYNSGHEDDEGNPMLITHRIVDKKVVEGVEAYQTQGDAVFDKDQQSEEQYITSNDIVSVFYSKDYHGKILRGFADFLRTIRSPQGFFGIILIPMIIFFLYAIFRVIINTLNYRKEKKTEAEEETEQEKKKAVEEAVAAALAEKENKTAAATPDDLTPEQMEQFKKFLEQQKAEQKVLSDTTGKIEDSPAE